MEKADFVAERKEILYDGYLYDVTDFIERHPGGGIITYYTQEGEDCTIAFEQFHMRSMTRVKAIMNSLKKRPATNREGNSVSFFLCSCS